jgi:hypothetical protein
VTENDWNGCTDPMPMLEFLREKASDRKLRLFACACCRRIWHLLTDERSRQGVEIAEGFAEGAVTVEKLSEALGLAWRAYHDFERTWIDSPDTASDVAFQATMTAAQAVGWVTQEEDPRLLEGDNLSRIERIFPVATETARYASRAASLETGNSNHPEQKAQAALLRDIFGPPFICPLSIDVTWQTGTVVALSQAIYDDRAFDRIPVLGDALEEAGCTNQHILDHCRVLGPHVRGCWLIDSLLGKE